MYDCGMFRWSWAGLKGLLFRDESIEEKKSTGNECVLKGGEVVPRGRIELPTRGFSGVVLPNTPDNVMPRHLTETQSYQGVSCVPVAQCDKT